MGIYLIGVATWLFQKKGFLPLLNFARLIGAVILPEGPHKIRVKDLTNQPGLKDSWISRANSRRQPWITTRNAQVSKVQEKLEWDTVFSGPFLTLFGLPWLLISQIAGWKLPEFHSGTNNIEIVTFFWPSSSLGTPHLHVGIKSFSVSTWQVSNFV